MNHDGTSKEEGDKQEVSTAAVTATTEDEPKRRNSLLEAETPEAKRVKVEPTSADPKTSPDSSAHQSILVAQKKNTESTSTVPATACKVEASDPALKASHAPEHQIENAIGAGASENLVSVEAESNKQCTSSEPTITDAKSEPGTLTLTSSSPATIAEEKKTADPTTTTTTTQNAPAPQPPKDPLPIKALTMSHLQRKYSGELEYMLREFRKLERQLLGAKGATQIEESAGSRERREKLHSFILHLEDTIRQIELGCKLEAEGKTTVNVGVAGPDGETKSGESTENQVDAADLTNPSRQKEEEENVQKLEEHILANLLPVKVRLKKQLAAQQGATKNPAGMPAPRRGYPQPSDPDKGKGTFAAAAEQRRKQAEELAAAQQQHVPPAEPVDPEKTHFGKPLGTRGSSLTQKLHGQTLGSKARTHGHGVGLAKPSTEVSEEGKSKIMYGGVAPGSKQVVSGVAMAASAHKMVIDTSTLKSKVEAFEKSVSESCKPTAIHTSDKPERKAPKQGNIPDFAASGFKRKLEDPTLTEEERENLRRKLKKKKLIVKAKRRELERQRQAALQSAQSQGPMKGVGGRKKMVGKGNGKKRGPRTVEYICALCSESYNSVSDYNPWWALAQHACPKCLKTQIPRIDISSPANAIEYHPALLAHVEDNGGSGANNAANAPAANTVEAVEIKPAHVSSPSKYQILTPHTTVAAHTNGFESDLGSDLSDITDGNLSDVSLDSDDSDAEVLATMTPAEKAEHERFGHDYSGPKLSDSEASRLLILMLHANGCPCRHTNAQQKDVCRSTKYMMLHVRDCPGTTSTFDVCPFPWCRKVKHLLYHLVSCTEPAQCAICSPTDLTKQMQGLVGLNSHRLKKQRQRLLAAVRSNQAARHQAKVAPSSQPPLAKPAPSSAKKPAPQRSTPSGPPPSKPKPTAARTSTSTKARPTTQHPQTTEKIAAPTRTVTAANPDQNSAPVNPAPKADNVSSNNGVSNSVKPSFDAAASTNVAVPEAKVAETQSSVSKPAASQPVAAESTLKLATVAAPVVNNPVPIPVPEKEQPGLPQQPQEKLDQIPLQASTEDKGESAVQRETPVEHVSPESTGKETAEANQATPNTTSTTLEASSKSEGNSNQGSDQVKEKAEDTNDSTLELPSKSESNSDESGNQAKVKTEDASDSDEPKNTGATPGEENEKEEIPATQSIKKEDTRGTTPSVRQTRSSARENPVLEEDKRVKEPETKAAGDAVKESTSTPTTDSEICRPNSSSGADQPSCSKKTVAPVRVA